MTDREAMRLALDALENHTAIKHPQQMHYRDTAIEALRQALAEPNILDQQLQFAIKRWDESRAYAMELQKRLRQYEKGSPMHLNKEQP